MVGKQVQQALTVGFLGRGEEGGLNYRNTHMLWDTLPTAVPEI